jgi:hypothetical protein
MNAVTYI